MNHIALALLVLATTASAADFPTSPNSRLTPGSLCHASSQLRYPERIRYCSRSVSSAQKREVIARYDRELGYRVGARDRSQFKVDHYIPLCMGGSNHSDNLWPQHMSVYQYTDKLEQVACEKMSDGHLSQREAIEYIKRAKANPVQAPRICDQVARL